jgi:hypothetical protein
MEFSLMPHFLCCVHAQQKITITGSGSFRPFAALSMIVRSRPEAS